MLRLSVQCAVHSRTVCLLGRQGTCGVDAMNRICFDTCAEDQDDEAAELVKELVHLHETRAVPWGEMAILYRQIRQAAVVASCFAAPHCRVLQPSGCLLGHAGLSRRSSWCRLPASLQIAQA